MTDPRGPGRPKKKPEDRVKRKPRSVKLPDTVDDDLCRVSLKSRRSLNQLLIRGARLIIAEFRGSQNNSSV